jgi:hypothetical protein
MSYATIKNGRTVIPNGMVTLEHNTDSINILVIIVFRMCWYVFRFPGLLLFLQLQRAIRTVSDRTIGLWKSGVCTPAKTAKAATWLIVNVD